MTEAIDAAGDLAAGMLLAKAVEPVAGAPGAATSTACLNCRAPLTSPFCGQCGQSTHIHRSVHTFGHDFLHSIFHFDGKIWRTLPMLFFKPGELTRRYVHGERARFVSPLALFLFSVFAMFAVFSWVGGPFTPDVNTKRNGVVLTTAEIDKELAIARKELAGLEARQKAEGGSDFAIEGEIIGKQQEIKGLETGKKFAAGIGTGRTLGDGETSDLIASNVDVDTGWKAFDEKVRHAIKNPQFLIYKVQSNAYKFSWLLIPLSLPFVWLMFAWKREVKIYDHLVFITYSLCFVTFLLVLMSFLGRAGPLEALRGPLLIAGLPVHMFVQLRGAYALRWKSALWRTVMLISASWIVLLVFAAILFALGLS